MAYVSNRLVHWAGSGRTPDEQYTLLTRNILQPRLLKYGACPWKFRSKYGGVKNFKIEMICFTDIPFSETETHCTRYSPFGVSFEKSYLVNCLACPVGYVQNPLVHQNFSYIYHILDGVRQQSITVDTGQHAGKAFDVAEILKRLMYMMVFKEDYSREEYKYNELIDEPLPDQQKFFEDLNSLYFEREWRMVLSPTAKVPWHVVTDGLTYFRFKEKFMGPIIMPREYVARFGAERDEVFAEYDRNWFPVVLAYEDLRFM